MAKHDGNERASQADQAGHHGGQGSMRLQERRVLPLAGTTLERRAHLDDNDEEIWNQRERVSPRTGLGQGSER